MSMNRKWFDPLADLFQGPSRTVKRAYCDVGSSELHVAELRSLTTICSSLLVVQLHSYLCSESSS